MEGTETVGISGRKVNLSAGEVPLAGKRFMTGSIVLGLSDSVESTEVQEKPLAAIVRRVGILRNNLSRRSILLVCRNA